MEETYRDSELYQRMMAELGLTERKDGTVVDAASFNVLREIGGILRYVTAPCRWERLQPDQQALASRLQEELQQASVSAELSPTLITNAAALQKTLPMLRGGRQNERRSVLRLAMG